MQVEKAASTKVCSGGGNQRDKEFEGLVEDTGGTNDRFINGEICREDLKKCDRGMEVYNQRRREDKRAAAPVRREERSGRQSRFRGVGRWRRR